MNSKNTTPPEIENEFDRLIELSEMDIEYDEIKDYLSDLNKLAAKITNTPISFVNLIDSYTQWTVSHEGFELDQMPREESVCQFTITEEEDFEVHDLSKDERFNKKSYVTDEPNLRFYYGVPLTTRDGHNIGALCVLDKTSKVLDPEKKEFLKLIAGEVVKRLEFLKEHNTLKQKIDELKQSKKKVGHDIRGPLGGIIGLTDVIRDELDADQAGDILKMIDLIKKGGQSVLELAEEIMKQSDEKDEPDANEFSTATFLEKLKELYLPQAKTKNIELLFEDHCAEESIFFPKTKLTQIVGNLISNSIKFTPEEGQVRVVADIKDAETEKRSLFIQVEDTGVGISPEKKKEILSGQQTSEKGTQGEKGYGFGLTLVNHLIEKADGRLHIDSEPGEGSRFEIHIPV